MRSDAAALGGRRKLFVLVGLLALLGAALLGCGPHTSSQSGAAAAAADSSCPAPSPSTPGEATSKLPLRALCALPAQAAHVSHTIATGGKQTYSRDGIVFNNAEKRLPLEARGYYHEYTVPTPGAKTRGTRRLITGSAHELYYTGDHYNSFVVVDPNAD